MINSMINILKDLLNIKNWIKLWKNPSAIKPLIINRFFSYPSKRFAKYQNNFLRNFFIKFWIWTAKQNKSLNYYFFNDKKNDYPKFVINKNNLNFSETIFNSLYNNGIAIIENVLNEKEYKYICKKFEDLEKNSGKWKNGPKNITKSKDVDIFWAKDSKENFLDLIQISNLITKKIYGKIVDPSVEFYLHKSKNVPEEKILGENHFHMDRFLPNLKIYYSPFDIDVHSAPFKWVLGSHKINKKYLDYWNDLSNFDKDESFDDNSSYLSNFKNKDLLEALLKKNSLIIVFTNGIHCRKPFLKNNFSRKVVFLHYGNFNKLSLFNYKRFNKN
jgi:hypothetical protein